jgi:CheY-like chemotaxis protein
MMPAMDGPTTLKHLRKCPETRSIPVIFITARAQVRELESFRSLGAVGVISKPFDPMTLAAAVRGYAEPPDQRFDVLRGTFRQRLQRDATALAARRLALDDAAPTIEALAAIRAVVHSLAGAAGIFGYAEISDVASRLEAAMAGSATVADPVEDLAAGLDRLLGLLQRTLACP